MDTKIELSELKNLNKALAKNLANFKTNSSNPTPQMYKDMLSKVVEVTKRLIKITEDGKASEYNLLNSAAYNLYHDIKTLSEKLQYNDEHIQDFLAREDLAAIDPPKKENVDADFDDEEITEKLFNLKIQSREDPKTQKKDAEKPDTEKQADEDEDWDKDLEIEQQQSEGEDWDKELEEEPPSFDKKYTKN